MRPVQLCRFCKPGAPCPWCVETLGIRAWDLADQWAEEMKGRRVYVGTALDQQVVAVKKH